MTDVRLTATNPEDSSVVPVACNAKGELKLEEPLIYEFDGDLDGDLTVSGTGTFDTAVRAGGVHGFQADGAAIFGGSQLTIGNDGTLSLATNAGGSGVLQSSNYVLAGDGSCYFADGKAGITAEGHFWCKLAGRNQIVTLNNLVNGLGEWVEYDPNIRRPQDQELEPRSEKDISSESQ